MKKFWGILFAIVVSVFLCACGQEAVSAQGTGASWEEKLNLGNQYMDEMDYEAAIAAFTMAIEIDPNQAEAYAARGNAYVLSGGSEEHGANLTLAQADFEMAIRLDETYVEAYLGLADIYERMEDHETAAAILEQGFAVTQDETLAGRMVAASGSEEDAGGARSETVYDEDGSYYILEYDSNGNVIKQTRYREDGRYGIFEYDASGNIRKGTWYGSAGNIDHIFEYDYDSNENLIKLTSYDLDGTLMSYQIYEYDASGIERKITYYNADGTIYNYAIPEYDVNGNRIKTYGYFENGTLWYIDEFDANGDIINTTWY